MKNQPLQPAGHSNAKRRNFFRKLLGTLAFGTVLAPFSGLSAKEDATSPHTANGRTASAEPFIGEISMFAGNFAPRGWAFCNGQLLPISQNQALFALLGTTYGGDGRTTFALPDLRGRVSIHPGNGPGLSSYRLGQRGGSEQQHLTVNQLPAHQHNITGNVSIPVNKKLVSGKPNRNSKQGSAQGSLMHSKIDSKEKYTGAQLRGTTSSAGGGQAINTVPPFLGVHYIIALQGIFPSRS